MKIRYEIAGSVKRGEMQAFVASSPKPLWEARDEFLRNKYYAWIIENVSPTQDFEFETLPINNPVVGMLLTFNIQSEGAFWKKYMGGVILEP